MPNKQENENTNKGDLGCFAIQIFICDKAKLNEIISFPFLSKLGIFSCSITYTIQINVTVSS